ncbi:MAG: glycosyltransferase family 4 protein, partial [Flavobacterium sp.]
SLGAGGAEKSTLDLAFFLKNQNHDVKVICIERKEVGVKNYSNIDELEIIYLTSSNFFSQVRELKKIIQCSKKTLVYSSLFRSNLLCRCTKMFVGFKHVENLVTTRYSIEKFKLSKNKLGFFYYYIIDFITIRFLTNYFHSITNTVTSHYSKIMLLKKSKIFTIYRGRKRSTKVKEYKNNCDCFKILTVGRQESVKGQIFLLQALNEMIQMNLIVNLTILGRNGNETKVLKEYVYRNNLNEYVNFAGYDLNTEDYYLKADLFVFPSIFEGLGGVLIEAQSYGLPIVCSDIEVFKEVVLVDKNALLFKNKDYKSLLSKILIFYNDRNLLEKFGKKGIQNYNDKFEEFKNFKILEEALQSII